MTEPITFTYTKEITVTVADSQDVPIQVGSVIKSLRDNDDCVGVVTRIFQEGDNCPLMSDIGDLEIKMSYGSHRYTNCYKEWIHVPREEQTYIHRLWAWKVTPYNKDFILPEYISREEGIAIEGIMALLPSDPVDWDNDQGPDTVDAALGYLVSHLEELQETNNKE